MHKLVINQSNVKSYINDELEIVLTTSNLMGISELEINIGDYSVIDIILKNIISLKLLSIFSTNCSSISILNSKIDNLNLFDDYNFNLDYLTIEKSKFHQIKIERTISNVTFNLVEANEVIFKKKHFNKVIILSSLITQLFFLENGKIDKLSISSEENQIIGKIKVISIAGFSISYLFIVDIEIEKLFFGYNQIESKTRELTSIIIHCMTIFHIGINNMIIDVFNISVKEIDIIDLHNNEINKLIITTQNIKTFVSNDCEMNDKIEISTNNQDKQAQFGSFLLRSNKFLGKCKFQKINFIGYFEIENQTTNEHSFIFERCSFINENIHFKNTGNTKFKFDNCVFDNFLFEDVAFNDLNFINVTWPEINLGKGFLKSKYNKIIEKYSNNQSGLVLLKNQYNKIADNYKSKNDFINFSKFYISEQEIKLKLEKYGVGYFIMLLHRYVSHYGQNMLRPLWFIFLVNIVFAFLFLYSGISISGKLICYDWFDVNIYKNIGKVRVNLLDSFIFSFKNSFLISLDDFKVVNTDDFSNTQRFLVLHKILMIFLASSFIRALVNFIKK